jgi:hypothetical protein
MAITALLLNISTDYDVPLAVFERARPLFERMEKPLKERGVLTPINLMERLRQKTFQNPNSFITDAHQCNGTATFIIACANQRLRIQASLQSGRKPRRRGH